MPRKAFALLCFALRPLPLVAANDREHFSIHDIVELRKTLFWHQKNIDNHAFYLFEGVCFETAVILAPGAMTGGVGAAVADTVSASSGSSGSSGSEFREGTDDCENTIHRAIFPGK